jgi:hypothetical protein
MKCERPQVTNQRSGLDKELTPRVTSGSAVSRVNGRRGDRIDPTVEASPY